MTSVPEDVRTLEAAERTFVPAASVVFVGLVVSGVVA